MPAARTHRQPPYQRPVFQEQGVYRHSRRANEKDLDVKMNYNMKIDSRSTLWEWSIAQSDETSLSLPDRLCQSRFCGGKVALGLYLAAADPSGELFFSPDAKLSTEIRFASCPLRLRSVLHRLGNGLWDEILGEVRCGRGDAATRSDRAVVVSFYLVESKK